MSKKTEVKKTCGTCHLWTQGQLVVVGECSAEMETTTRDNVCKINLWMPKFVKAASILLLLLLTLTASAETNTNDYLFLGTNRISWSMVHTNGMMLSTNHSPYSIERVRETGNVTNIVQMLAKEGEICSIFGHNWRDGRPGEGEGMVFLDYHPNTNFRTCRVCGKCQSQTYEWKESP